MDSIVIYPAKQGAVRSPQEVVVSTSLGVKFMGTLDHSGGNRSIVYDSEMQMLVIFVVQTFIEIALKMM